MLLSNCNKENNVKLEDIHKGEELWILPAVFVVRWQPIIYSEQLGQKVKSINCESVHPFVLLHLSVSVSMKTNCSGPL